MVITVFVLILRFFANRYEKVGPNEVLIVSGRSGSYTSSEGEVITKNFKIYHGSGTFVLPIREKVDEARSVIKRQEDSLRSAGILPALWAAGILPA